MPLANTAIVWQLIHQELTLGYSASGMSIPSVGRFSFNFLRYSTDSVHGPQLSHPCVLYIPHVSAHGWDE